MDGKIFVLFLSIFIKAQATINEPACFSSFDFQEKLLEKMVVLSHKVDTLQHLFSEKLEELSVKTNQLKDDRLAMNSELKADRLAMNSELKVDRLAMNSELKKISTDLNNNMEIKMTTFETKITTFEKQQKNKLEETNQKVGDFLAETNLKLQRFSFEMSAMNASFRDNLKLNVAFLARTVSNAWPGTNEQLVFTQALLNTYDVYDNTTGNFTAPVEGTYLFSSQICGHAGKRVNFRIFVNDEMNSDTTQYDGASFSCTTSTTVAILKVGDCVCVKTGPGTSSGKAIKQGIHWWSMFQGALVN